MSACGCVIVAIVCEVPKRVLPNSNATLRVWASEFVHPRASFSHSVRKSVVECRADLLDGLVSTVRPATIGEEDHGKLAFRVDPKRGSGVVRCPIELSEKYLPDDDSSLGVSSQRADRPGRPGGLPS